MTVLCQSRSIVAVDARMLGSRELSPFRLLAEGIDVDAIFALSSHLFLAILLDFDDGFSHSHGSESKESAACSQM